ncbi:MAG: ABC transporter substrate-binding protein [Gammaproteobacteria bacterium]
MWLKRLLVLLPLALTLALLQSFFWVPTYEHQAVGNPKRLQKFISASGGDAKLLNPILYSDTVSGQIVDAVFQGLLDLDEDMRVRGRLATGWQITERAYLLINPEFRFADGQPADAARLLRRIEAARASGAIQGLEDLVVAAEVLPPSRRRETLALPPADAAAPQSITLAIEVPERIAFSLSRVDQDFFRRLTPVLGEHYVDHFPYAQFIHREDGQSLERLLPQFAAVLPVMEHNPAILFQLRRGVRFHDGRPFTAKDVRFTYEAIMEPRNLSPRVSDFEPIKAVEVLDAHTVRVVYKRLYSPAIGAWTMGILPEHLLNRAALEREMDARGLSAEARAGFGIRDSEFNRRPIGTGPFRFIAWKSDEYIQLRRNEDYWEGPPEYHDYYLRIIPDILTQEVEFRSGAIDYYGALPHQVARYTRAAAYQSFSSLVFAYSYIGYNLRRPLLSDRRVRRALGMAVDVDQVIKYLVYGEGTRITGPFPIESDWYDRDIPPLPYDPPAALRLFEEAGWTRNADGWLERDGKRFEINLITNSGNPLRKDLLTIVQDAWKKIGVKCNTQYFEWAVFLEDFVDKGEFDALILGWTTSPLDPDLYQIFHSSQTGPKQLNFAGYKNPEADRLIVQIRQEYEHARQKELAYRLHGLIADDQPYTFLYTPRATTVLDKKIVIVEREPPGAERFAKIYPTQSGNVFFHFNKWRKLELTPDF